MNQNLPKKTGLRYPSHWLQRKLDQHKISVLTAYDATTAHWLSQSQVDALLVGDSLGMAVQGHTSTLTVSLEEMIYHSRMVRRGAPFAFLIGDMPFASYRISTEQAIRNAIRLFQKGKLDAIKVEGAGSQLLQAIQQLGEAGVPVMGHIGMTPQSYLNKGGFQIQGKDAHSAERLKNEALALQDSGCFAIVLELITESLTKNITDSLRIPSIGIGSGPHTSGQVLVINDLLGLTPGTLPKHARVYAHLGEEMMNAANRYHSDVKNNKF